MPTTKQVRRSVTLPAQIAQQVERLAKRRRLSDNRVLVELIETGHRGHQAQGANVFRARRTPQKTRTWPRNSATSWAASFSGNNAADRELVAPTGSDSRSTARPDA